MGSQRVEHELSDWTDGFVCSRHFISRKSYKMWSFLSIGMFSGFIHVCICSPFIFLLNNRLIPHCMDMLYFIHSSFELFLLWDYYKYAASENLCTSFYVDIRFWSSWAHTLRVELLGHMQFCVQHFVDLPNCFPKWLNHFTIPPVMFKDSSFSTFLSELVNVIFMLPILMSVT